MGDLSFSEEKEGQVAQTSRATVGGRDWEVRSEGGKTVTRQETIS